MAWMRGVPGCTKEKAESRGGSRRERGCPPGGVSAAWETGAFRSAAPQGRSVTPEGLELSTDMTASFRGSRAAAHPYRLHDAGQPGVRRQLRDGRRRFGEPEETSQPRGRRRDADNLRE
ncbi:hypothetical protein GCM10010129_58430 [Streptomyces fumigatiscleroticus]|nr:hypothetical protein GCM10010129_58430 [Streptomyces fumigatiscleroticus]